MLLWLCQRPVASSSDRASFSSSSHRPSCLLLFLVSAASSSNRASSFSSSLWSPPLPLRWLLASQRTPSAFAVLRPLTFGSLALRHLQLHPSPSPPSPSAPSTALLPPRGLPAASLHVWPPFSPLALCPQASLLCHAHQLLRCLLAPATTLWPHSVAPSRHASMPRQLPPPSSSPPASRVVKPARLAWRWCLAPLSFFAPATSFFLLSSRNLCRRYAHLIGLLRFPLAGCVPPASSSSGRPCPCSPFFSLLFLSLPLRPHPHPFFLSSALLCLLPHIRLKPIPSP